MIYDIYSNMYMRITYRSLSSPQVTTSSWSPASGSVGCWAPEAIAAASPR